MSVRSSQAVTVLFTTRTFATGVATNADSLPTGTLYVNGTSNAATVTVTNVTTGLYTAAVTLPTLAIGDIVDIRINATVGGVTDNAVVWRDTKDVLLDASGQTTNTVTPLDAAGVRSAVGLGSANLDTQLSAIAGYIDTEVTAIYNRIGAPVGASLSADIAGIQSDTDSIQVILTPYTSARAGYLDNLNIGGNVASSSEVTSIQNNTRVVRVVPEDIELPTSGTRTYRIEIFLYDTAGNMEAPDSAPTIALVNQGGTDRSARLDSTTMSLVETGRYRAVYTSSSGDTKEQLVWTFSVIEGGNTRKYGNTSYVTDAVATDFTTADRTKLDNLHDVRLTAARAGYLDNIATGSGLNNIPWNSSWDAEVESEVTDALNTYDPPTNAEMVARTLAATAYATAANQTTILTNQATIAAYIDNEVSSIKGVTDKLDTTLEVDGAVYRFTTNALEMSPAGGGGGGATVDEIWDELNSAHMTAGSMGANLALAATAANHIGTARITVTSIITEDGEVGPLVAGDSYYAADSRAIEWTGTTANQWPNLTGATITLYVDDGRLTVTGSVVTPTGTQKVRVELSSDNTALLGQGTYHYTLKATLSNTHVITLATSTMEIKDTESS